MGVTEPGGDARKVEEAPHFVAETGTEEVRAWEQIEAGRFMPRRTRGSSKGRALG